MYEATLQKTKTVTKKKLNRIEKMLINPDVKRWFDNVARGSQQTAEVRCRRLGEFCDSHDMTPMEFAELGRKNALDAADLLQDHVSWMEQKCNSPGYIDATITALKSWLTHFDVVITRKIKVANRDATPTLEDERVPEGEELTELFNRADLRTGAIMALISKSGVRPQVIGNHTATDGLMIKDLPDLAIVQGRATFTNNPPKVIVRKTISKARHEYFTFITPLAAKKLLAYLNQRILDGESLAPNAPVIAPDTTYHHTGRGNNKDKLFLPTRRVSRIIRETIRPRFTWRPYVLRAFFDTQLLIAESRGKIAHDFRVFFMGHKGSIEAKYTTNKRILPNALIHEMREAFRRSSEFLDLEISEANEEEKKKEELKRSIETLPPEKVLELLGNLRNGKNQTEANESSMQTKQKNSSTKDGNISEHYQTERLSSKKDSPNPHREWTGWDSNP